MRSERELEICVETLQACNAAAEGGANRIELCSALGEGGVTPSRGLIRGVIEQSTLPVHILIRPRVGNFVFTKEEFRVMCEDVEDVLALGAAGVVVGALTSQSEIDRDQTATLVRLAHGLSVTFHRAFDHTHDLAQQLEVVVNLGCSRVLTSGGMPTVTQGHAMLEKLARQAAGRIRIAAGGGLTLEAAAHLRNIEGLDFHASVRRRGQQSSSSISDPLWNTSTVDGSIRSEDVRNLRETLGFGPRSL